MFTPLKNGSTGENVKHLQSFLKLKVDGDFGNNTEKAVKEWQKKKGLLDDGIVGSKTWEAMTKSKLLSRNGSASPIPNTDGLSVIRGAQWRSRLSEYASINTLARKYGLPPDPTSNTRAEAGTGQCKRRHAQANFTSPMARKARINLECSDSLWFMDSESLRDTHG